MITIKSVADYSGFSISTVSNYLNGKPVSKEAAKKISLAIEELGYQPNFFGRSLRTKKTFSVGVIVFDLATQFIADICTELEKFLHHKGYDVFFCNTNGDVEIEKEKINCLINRGVDAIVIFPRSYYHTDISAALNADIPIITLDGMLHDNKCSSISFDDEQAAYLATKYLIKNGHKEIAYIAGHNDYYTTIARQKGYEQALRDANIKNKYLCTDISDDCTDRCLNFFYINTNITATLISSSSLLVDFLSAAKMLSLKIPDDISYVTFDNSSYFKILNTTPTYVYQDKVHFANELNNVLDELLSDPKVITNKTISTHLKIGRSVKQLKETTSNVTYF